MQHGHLVQTLLVVQSPRLPVVFIGLLHLSHTSDTHM
jgi:hypothetical protein